MTALFADTFYWIALADFNDSAHQRAMTTGLYIQRPDKGYSLTDCISMQTMRREGLTEALTKDRHFEQEGFQVLFREP
jgi:hypothetical protein